MTDRFHFPRAAFPAEQTADAAPPAGITEEPCEPALAEYLDSLQGIERRTRPEPQVTIEDALRMVRRMSGWTMGRVIDDPDGWDRLRDDARALLDRAAA